MTDNSKRARIGVVTTSRADYGIYKPVLDALHKAEDIDLELWVTGMHMSPEFGSTVNLIENDGFEIAARIESLVSADSEESIAVSMGLTTMRLASSFAQQNPDLLVVLGDRFEMHAAACAAIPLRIPLAHIHGGEETENAIDNVFRHSMTKLSQLHFTSTNLARSRVVAMGENPEHVIVSGAPALDAVSRVPRMSASELAERFDLPLDAFVLVTFHPETLNPTGNLSALETVWNAAMSVGLPVVFTESNADAMGRQINEWLKTRCADTPNAQLIGTLGAQGYYSAMAAARLMIGNSSSGIIEAASFQLPVINVGDRQRGRETSANTVAISLDAPDGGKQTLQSAIQEILSPSFQASLEHVQNVYGDGQAASRILEGVRHFIADGAPVTKKFHSDKP